MVRKSISLSESTYDELVKLGTGYKESMDDIVTKCIRSYKKEYKIK